MRLFRSKPQPPEPTGRRRPTPSGHSMPDRPSQAFSYYSQRSDRLAGNATANVQPTERRTGRHDMDESVRRPRRMLFGALAVPAVIAGIYLLILSDTPRVVLLQDETTAYFLQDTGVYQQSAQQALSASPFNRNKITVDTSSVRLALLKDYPEVQNVSVELPIIGQQPQVYIEPYKPSFIMTTTSSNAFLLDSTGRALTSTSLIPDVQKLGLLTLQDRSGRPIKLGTRAVPSTTVTFAQTVVAVLAKADIRPASLVLPAAAYELDVYIPETPYFVKFNLQNNPLQQAGTFLATKKRLEADRIRPGQYIDVRVPERAYYK